MKFFENHPRIKLGCQKLFIYTWGLITKIIPFLCYMFLVPFSDLEYFYWSVYIFITFINIMILSEVIASFVVLIREGDTQIRYSDILRACPVSQIPDVNGPGKEKTRMGIILVGYLPNEINILPQTLKYLHEKMNLDLCEIFLCLIVNGAQKVEEGRYQQFLDYLETLKRDLNLS